VPQCPRVPQPSSSCCQLLATRSAYPRVHETENLDWNAEFRKALLVQ